ncbi:MAG: hypothetical protein HKN87_19885 [Saprospiraceae bacterium]|nr:hypothetical protein [Saprospiraceae bacterium]
MDETAISTIAALTENITGTQIKTLSGNAFICKPSDNLFHQGILGIHGRIVSSTMVVDVEVLRTHSETKGLLERFCKHLAILQNHPFTILPVDQDQNGPSRIKLRFQFDTEEVGDRDYVVSWLESCMKCTEALRRDLPVLDQLAIEKKYSTANLEYVYPFHDQKLMKWLDVHQSWFHEISSIIRGDYPLVILCDGILCQQLCWRALATHLTNDRRSIGLLKADFVKTSWKLIDILGVWQRNIDFSIDVLARLSETALTHEFSMVCLGHLAEQEAKKIENAVTRIFPDQNVSTEILLALSLEVYGRRYGGIAVSDSEELFQQMLTALQRFGPVSELVLISLVKANLRQLPDLMDPSKNLEYLFAISKS